MTTGDTHDELVQQQFSQQAARFDTYVTAGGNEDVLAWIMGNLELEPHYHALDVAAGTGLVARQIAPSVQAAVALDATPEMLSQGRHQAHAEGLTNMTFDQGDAANLPYPDGSFDLVTCRLGMHHFADPQRQLEEMARVCRPGGQVVIIDITTSEDSRIAATHNRLERLRDPSHTVALTSAQLLALAENAGLEVASASQFDAHRGLDDWMDLTGTAPDDRESIAGELRQELDGGPATGMSPFLEDGRLMFHHLWFLLVGRRPA